jgi:hypothetical protein
MVEGKSRIGCGGLGRVSIYCGQDCEAHEVK